MNSRIMAVAATVVLTSFACVVSQAAITPGVSAGMNSAGASIIDIDGAKAPAGELKGGIGLQGGVLLDIGILGLVSIVPAVEYSTVAAKRDSLAVLPPDTISTNWDFKAGYLAVPVLIKVKYPFGIIAPYIAAGPEFDLLVSQKTTVHRRQTQNSFGFPVLETTEDRKGFLTAFALGLTYGGGLELDLGSMTPFFQAAYHLNLTNQQKGATGKQFFGFNFLNVRAGLRFKM